MVLPSIPTRLSDKLTAARKATDKDDRYAKTLDYSGAATGLLRMEAIKLGCANMKLVSQSYGPLQQALKARNQEGGICSTLVIEWFAARARSEDLVDRLLQAGGAVNETVLDELVAKFAKNNDKSSSLLFIKNRLKGDHGFQLQSEDWEKVDPAGVASAVEFGPVATLCRNRDDWPLRYVSFQHEGGGHAVGLDLTVGKETFFDPNFGVFDFAQKLPALTQFLNEQVFREPQDRGPAKPANRPACVAEYLGSDNKDIKYFELLRFRGGRAAARAV